MKEKSEMIERHLKSLKSIRGRAVEAGWFSSARYPASPSGEGVQVARIARLLEYGGTIDHPGGTKYIRDAIVGQGKNRRFVGTRFVSNSFEGEHETTSAHKIVIPARPFMRFAWTIFSNDRAALQKKICRKLATGKISPEQALAQIGLALEGVIAKSMKTGPWEPNAPATAAKKGFNKPLIDSAHMLQSISSKVS